MKLKNKTLFKLKEVILIVIITSVTIAISAGLIVSKRLNNQVTQNPIKVNKIDDANLDNFINAYNTLLSNYYKDVNEKELISTLIDTMTDYLKDPYTSYLNEEETNELLSTLNGKYVGIGVKIQKTDNGVEIVEIFSNSPAEAVGLLKGDVITKINDENVSNSELEYIVTKIKSNTASFFKVTVLRNKKEYTFNLNLADIDLPSVKSEIITNNNKKVGYIHISTFASNTYTQFKKQLEGLENDGIESLIIDVRTDTGGYLTTATEIIELFLKKGVTMYSVKAKTETINYLDDTDDSRDYKIVLLGNEYSASASEILISSLKDSYGATFVGKTTYGKGKIQQTTSLEDGGMLKYTTAEWLTPKGVCIDGKGITPDYEAEYTLEKDYQLDKAVELLTD